MNPFANTEYSIRKKLLELDWKKAIYFAFFVLAYTLLVAMIFTYKKVNLLYFKNKKASNKVSWENVLLRNGLSGKSQLNGHYIGWLMTC